MTEKYEIQAAIDMIIAIVGDEELKFLAQLQKNVVLKDKKYLPDIKIFHLILKDIIGSYEDVLYTMINQRIKLEKLIIQTSKEVSSLHKAKLMLEKYL